MLSWRSVVPLLRRFAMQEMLVAARVGRLIYMGLGASCERAPRKRACSV
jgi:hypothetical protein